MNTNKIRVGILFKGFINWGGGLDFLRYIINALLLNRNEYELVLIVPKIESALVKKIKKCIKFSLRLSNDLLRFRKPVIRKDYYVSKSIFSDFVQDLGSPVKIVHYNHKNKFELMRALKNERVDVILPSIEALGKDFPYRWIGYIYDFQHKYLPDYFPEAVRRERDHSFQRIVTDSEVVIVNSISVKNDISSFIPQTTASVFNLPFCPYLDKKWLTESGVNLKSKYSLPDRFFLISNQFWIHKSHNIAFRALKHLHERGSQYSDVHIVCTGDTIDPRFPQYFEELATFIDENRLNFRIHILGLIPKSDQIGIMKKALAVLQPTQFEGGPGGGSVYDAVSLGIPAIVSDIPINKEINEKRVVFFKTNDAVDLCNKMICILGESYPKIPDEELITESEARLKELSLRVSEAIRCSLERS